MRARPNLSSMVRSASTWARRFISRVPALSARPSTCRAAARAPRASARRVAARLIAGASAIFTWYSEHIVSQKRGGAIRQYGHVVRGPALEQRFVAPGLARVGVAPHALHLVQADQRRVLVVFEPAHVIDDDPLDAGQRVAHGQDLVGLFLVLDQDEARLAVVKDEPHVLRQAVHEDPDRDGTGRLRGELGIA